jgi:hypothetical protein
MLAAGAVAALAHFSFAKGSRFVVSSDDPAPKCRRPQMRHGWWYFLRILYLSKSPI